MNGQPNQGLASLTGGMGGSPTLGGAPQTPPTPQGAQQPQPTPQGGLPPDLLKALGFRTTRPLLQRNGNFAFFSSLLSCKIQTSHM